MFQNLVYNSLTIIYIYKMSSQSAWHGIRHHNLQYRDPSSYIRPKYKYQNSNDSVRIDDSCDIYISTKDSKTVCAKKTINLSSVHKCAKGLKTHQTRIHLDSARWFLKR